jgi:hypothetical protein
MNSPSKRKLNPQSIVWRDSYSVTELAEILGVTVRTVQLWHASGMAEVEGTVGPLLFMVTK